jgi:hypothetical protein
VTVALVPETAGVDSLARQIRVTGRAYPLFDIAHLILAKPERYSVTVSSRKSPEGQALQPLFVCAIDDTLWLSADEAVAWALDKHFGLFYQAERTQIEPPKGTYTFVAQCGMSGIILGPPNHHDYQNRMRRLHQERFSRMPFEAFKARVRIVRDEAVVKKWIEEQSFKTEYVCLNMPEPLRLGSREEVERHFRETHAPNIIKQVETHHLGGQASRNLRCSGLYRAVRQSWEDQRRFPIQVATVLSQQFASRGLQFFKVDRTVTHVAVARPHYLDLEAAPVSEGVRRIVEFINANPKCTRKKLLDSLAPAPVSVAVQSAATPPSPGAFNAASHEPVTPAATPAAEPAAVEQGTATEAGSAPPSAEAAPGAPGSAPAAPPESPERTAILTDLHWLIHQGHVLEFANGALETAKKPLPKPPKTPKKAAEVTTAEGTVSVEGAEPAPAATPPSEPESNGREPGGDAPPTEPVAQDSSAATSESVVPERPPASMPATEPEPKSRRADSGPASSDTAWDESRAPGSATSVAEPAAPPFPEPTSGGAAKPPAA